MNSLWKSCAALALSGLLLGAEKPKSTDVDGLPVAMRVEAIVIDLAKTPTQVLETKSKRRINKVWGFNPALTKVIPTSDPRKITLTGIKQGVSVLHLTDEDGIEDKLTIVVLEHQK